MEKKLFLIDGHSLIFRMYYAFVRRPMINSKGADVSILYGFTKYLLELVEREKPTHLAVCFDPPGKTFRHTLYPEYKGTRQATPELVINALDPLVEICTALEIPVLMVPGFEGDDVLASMAVRSAGEGMTVYMVTPDKDFGQVVSERIFQYKPGKSGADNEIIGPSELCEKLGLCNSRQVIDLLTICGDTSDNVPGVKGVGEVGASKLLKKYGSVDGIYAHLDELSEKQATLFRASEDHIALSRELVTIKTDIPLDTTADDMLLAQGHKAAVMELFDHYEFSSLKKYIRLSEGESPVQSGPSLSLEWKQVSPDELYCHAAEEKRCSLVITPDGNGIFASILEVTAAVASEKMNYVAKGSAGMFRKLLSDGVIAKTGYDLKMADNLLAQTGIRLGGRLEDLELIHYLINPEKSHKADVLVRSYLGVNLAEDTPSSDAAVPQMGLFDEIQDYVTAPADRCREAVAMALLFPKLIDELRSLDMERLFYQIEEPLIRVLARMERNGVKVDMAGLREYAVSLGAQIREIEVKIRETAGLPNLNLSSPKQVGEYLYGQLKIDPRKAAKDKKGPLPTDEETLLGYADSYPIIYDILEYRALKKLLGTYIEPFGNWVAPQDGRIHTTFNQSLTATGRLSSSHPNLQNIPIRTERGKEIRKAFVASCPDNVIVSADYSQIELRLMAHFCGDDNMRNAFCQDKDVHAITAAKIFKVPLSEVTPDMRRTAKTANFGIMYGISAFGLAQRLRIPRVAAKKIIEDYFESFPSISEWIEKSRTEASRNGFVQTLFGRRRYLPDINSRNATVRALAERNAVNAPIQGSAADIIKVAMNNVDRRLSHAAMKSRMVLQIHDELLFEAPQSEVEELMMILKQEMENVITLSVPLTIECSYGKNWLEAH